MWSCPLHHTKSSCMDARWTQGDFETVDKGKMSANLHHLQLGHHQSNIYLKDKTHLASMRSGHEVTLGGNMWSCPLHHTKSPIHVRWMRGDFETVDKENRLQIFIICSLEIIKVASKAVYGKVDMRWLWGCVCRVALSTAQSHLVWTLCLSTWGDFWGVCVELSPPPHKITLHGHSHLTLTFLPRIYLACSPSPMQK